MLNFIRAHISNDNPIRLVWHRLKGFLAAAVNGFPASKMVMIGITGTNGKTTTTHLIEHLLTSAGKKTGMISTVCFRINGKEKPNLTKKTTLSPFATQKFLKQCKKRGIEFGVVESSSHALQQSRLYGIPFSIGVLTNITHEHLDYHGTMEKYKEAKKILFKNVSMHRNRPHSAMILNAKASFVEEFKNLQGNKCIYGFDEGDVQAKNVTYSKFGAKFLLQVGTEGIGIDLKLSGSYNVENVLAAVGAVMTVGLTLEQIKKGLESFTGVPGRMERIESPKGFEVIVDFALTPDALERLYKNIKDTATGKVIGIIGSCGERDKEKRPVMGKIVADLTDLCIVTDEEPYSEDPLQIMAAVLQGAKQSTKKMEKDLFLIKDRYEAITFAIKSAQPGDTVVVTGMGHFTTRNMNSGSIPWDEREVVREIIKKTS